MNVLTRSRYHRGLESQRFFKVGNVEIDNNNSNDINILVEQKVRFYEAGFPACPDCGRSGLQPDVTIGSLKCDCGSRFTLMTENRQYSVDPNTG